MSQSRDWCVTINDLSGLETSDKVLTIIAQVKSLKYFVFQKESVNHDHYQCYVEFNGPCKFSTVKNHFKKLNNPHIEPRMKGTRTQARSYCMKDESRIEGPWEYGTWDEPKGQGKRSDLDEAVDKIKSGATLKRIAEENPIMIVKYPRGMSMLQSLLSSKKSRKCLGSMQVELHYGPSGIGKTTAIENQYPHGHQDVYWYTCQTNGKVWWDRYNEEKIVVINDFKGHYPYHQWLQLTDGSPLTVETKGSSIPIMCDKIIITSRVKPTEWYSGAKSYDEFELLRRITKYYIYKKPLGSDPIQVNTYEEFLTSS